MFSHLDISHTYVVEIRDLRALVAVVRSGSFTAAASELGYTQSAISQQIAALEAELGHRLLLRRPVRPTPAGERLAEHAVRILLRLEVARSELTHLDQGPVEIRVAVCPLAAPELLAAALRELRATNPRLQVTVRSVDRRAAVADVASGRVDVALVDGIGAPDNPLALADAGLLSSRALVETPLAVALAAGHPLQSRRSIDLDTLADAPWITAPGLAPSGIADLVPGPVLVGTAPTAASVVYEGNDLPTLLALIAAGHGTALLPIPCCSGVPGVAAIPLRNPPLVHRTEVLSLRTLTTLQRRLVDALSARASLA
jgi:DNA-binding transcriptional LysR family regulator